MSMLNDLITGVPNINGTGACSTTVNRWVREARPRLLPGETVRSQ